MAENMTPSAVLVDYLAAQQRLIDEFGKLVLYEIDYQSVPAAPLYDGDEFSDHWGWQSHLVNLRLRADSLADSIRLDMPPFLIHNALRLVEERVTALRELVDREYPLESGLENA